MNWHEPGRRNMDGVIPNFSLATAIMVASLFQRMPTLAQTKQDWTDEARAWAGYLPDAGKPQSARTAWWWFHPNHGPPRPRPAIIQKVPQTIEAIGGAAVGKPVPQSALI
jgi:hypothetical protein